MTSQLDDDEKLMALGRLQIILENDFNSILTEDTETDEPFLIVESWEELGKIQKELNRWLRPVAYYRNAIDYYNIQGDKAFQHMRFEVNRQYLVPEGLFELEDVCEWGFEDEYTTCGDCGKAIHTAPEYYEDKPRYVILEGDMLCGNCTHDHHIKEYIELCTNNEKNAINTRIVSEEELTKLGWKQLSRRYENGFHEGQNDKPSNVLNKLKKKFDVLFTYETSQFDVTFWAWVKNMQSD